MLEAKINEAGTAFDVLLDGRKIGSVGPADTREAPEGRIWASYAKCEIPEHAGTCGGESWAGFHGTFKQAVEHVGEMDAFHAGKAV